MDINIIKDHAANQVALFETKHYEWLPHSILIDIEKLPPKLNNFIVKYLMLKIPSTPISALLHSTLANIAMIIGNNRCTCSKPEGGTTPLHLYTMLYMRSGAGKDKSFNCIQDLIIPIRNDFSNAVFDCVRKYNKCLIGEYEKRAAEDVMFKKLHPKIDSWIFTNKAELPSEHIGFATSEGLTALALKCKKVGINCVNINIPEFLQRMNTSESLTDRFIEFISIAYDNGQYQVKSTKTSDVATSLDGGMREITMNTNVHVHSDPTGLREMPNTFMTKMRQSLIRRFILCFIAPEDFMIANKTLESIEESGEKALEDSEIAKKNEPYWQSHFRKMFDITYPNTLGSNFTHKNIEVDRESTIFLNAYNKFCEYRQLICQDHTEGTEIGTRHWRALKIAAMITAFDLRITVTIQDAKYAMYIVEHYGSHVKRYIMSACMSNVAAKDVLNYIIEGTRTSGYVRQSKIYDQSFFPAKNKTAMAPTLAAMTPDLKLYAMELGLDLVNERHGNTIRWFVRSLPEAISQIQKDNTNEIVNRFENILANREYSLSDFDDDIPF